MFGNSQSPESLKRIDFSQQQVSVAAAAVLMLIFCSFMAGYFFSQRDGTLEEGSFDLMNFEREAAAFQQSEGRDSLPNDAQQKVKLNHDTAENNLAIPPVGGMSQLEKRNVSKQYYAQLVGFGTVEAARICVKKLKRYGVPALVEDRVSKTGGGKLHRWYQVVTEPQDSPDALIAIVERAKKLLSVKDSTLKER